MKHSLVTFFGLFLLNFQLVTTIYAQQDLNSIPYGNNDMTGNFITVDNVKIYFEIYGQGAPLVLIHGNGGNIASMQP